MDLSLSTGRGPAALANLDGLGPLVRDEDVVILGFRDEELLPRGIASRRVAELRSAGIRETARREIARLRAGGVRGFWIHLDADVLDPEIFPAVDTPEPGGLLLAELAELLQEALASDLAVGMQVCIYDPDLDPVGHCARDLSGVLAAAFQGSPRPELADPHSRFTVTG
jgi:arginase